MAQRQHKPKKLHLPITKIVTDEVIQARTGINLSAVADYAEAMAQGDAFPPLVVFQHKSTYWLADGFHRLKASQEAGLEKVVVTVHRGTRRDALLYAIGANAHHGLRRTNADKRKAVRMLLSDKQWSKWSDRTIAKKANVSNRFVSTIRGELTVNVHSESDKRHYVTKHGTVTQMETAKIGTKGDDREQPAISVGKSDPEPPPYTPCPQSLLNRIILGDCRQILTELPDNCIDCVVTSPPYWALRDYGTEGQIGLEPTFEEYIDTLCTIFDEIKRVLKDAGTCWVNMGDTYSGSNCGSYDHAPRGKRNRHIYQGQRAGTTSVADKSLLQIPSRFAIEMTNRGWILRNEIIWHKPNVMPSSVKDRFTVDFEKVLFFSKNRHYYFETQREPSLNPNDNRTSRVNPFTAKDHKRKGNAMQSGDGIYPERIKRAVWNIPTHPFKDAHFAVFPPELIETPIKAGCPEMLCRRCGVPRTKIYEGKSASAFNIGARDTKTGRYEQKWGQTQKKRPHYEQYVGDKDYAGEGKTFVGYTDCGCNAGWNAGVVLDPFMGSGTTALVALQLQRNVIGIELSEEYCRMAEARVARYVGKGNDMYCGL